ncbi:MAG: phosphoribosylanthranilate isomerase [Lachnospiraceae bacterium]
MAEQLKIKFCGLRRMEDIMYANETRPDYVGFVFAPTKRYIEPQEAKRLKEALHPDIQTVGVFVNESPQVVADIACQGIIDWIQLHGQEDADYIRQLRQLSGCPIMKAIRVRKKEDIDIALDLPVDYFLLDKYDEKEPGGTGKVFDWSLIQEMKKPFFLAGGLNAGNVSEGVALHPYGIDISSGIETDGKKDLTKMRQIMHILDRDRIRE